MFDLNGYNAKIQNSLGVTCWWTINRIQISEESIKIAMQQNGIDEKFLPELTSKKALRRAGQDISKEDHRFVRTINDGKATVIGIVKEHVDKVLEKLDYDQTTTARLTKDNETLEVSGAGAEEFKTQFKHYQSVATDYDIRFMVGNVLRAINAVALRASGGIYFVPKHKVDVLMSLDKVLRSLGCGSMKILSLEDTENSREITWDALAEEVEKQIKAVMDSTDKITKKMSAITTAEEKMAEVQELFETYNKLLEKEQYADEIRAKFEVAEKKIADKLVELQKQAKE